MQWLLSILMCLLQNLIFIFSFVKLRVFLVELRARAIAQSSAENRRVTQSDN